ncbi:MAG: hypothetical protein P8J86_03520 [Phycisphaerales bacterium]|nr:hypothetical protein [Phycisphaerales bacterium]
MQSTDNHGVYALCLNSLLVALVATTALNPDLSAQTGIGVDSTAQPAIRRSRTFDFEEAAQRPVAFPDFFFRPGPDQGAGAQGFPLFGSIEITEQTSHLGHHALAFSPDGHSMAARLMTGACPVLPGTDYHVSAHIRTEGLKRSRARVVAWLLDEKGTAIPGTHQESELIITKGNWEIASIIVPTDHPAAIDLVLELQVLQPAQLLRDDSGFEEPVLADIGGQVWFDDVVVEQKPRVSISTLTPTGISLAPEQPQLVIQVEDMSATPLHGVLRIADHQGQILAAIELENLGNAPARTLALPLSRFGWFQATLELHEHGRILTQKTVNLAWLPSISDHEKNNRLGVSWSSTFTDTQERSYLQSAISLINELPVKTVQIPIWPSIAPSEQGSILLVDTLIERQHTLLLVLAELPDALARSLQLKTDQVFEAITERFAASEPFLIDLMISAGIESTRWQVGASDSPRATMAYIDNGALPDMPTGLDRLIPNATMYLPWPATLALPDLPEQVSLTLTLDSSVNPNDIGKIAAQWKEKAPDAVVLIETTTPGVRANNGIQQPAQIAQLTMNLWRFGPATILLDQPWTKAAPNLRQMSQPDATFCVWRTLATQLTNRIFAGQLDLADGIHAWVLQGQTPADACLVLWTDTHDPWSRQTVSLLLGMGDMTSTDLFGNRFSVPMIDGAHLVEIGPEPIFIEGIDASLLDFVATMALTPSFVPAIHRATEMELTIRNPWKTALIASIELEAPAGWRITPRTSFVNLSPAQEITIPIEAVIPVNVTSGTHLIEARADLTTDRHYELKRLLPIRTGLPDVSVAAATHTVIGQMNDVAVQLSLDNQSSSLRTVRISTAGPGLRQIAPTSLQLEPHGITHHRLLVPGGFTPANDGTLWLILEDADSNARLTKPLDLITAVQP